MHASATAEAARCRSVAAAASLAMTRSFSSIRYLPIRSTDGISALADYIDPPPRDPSLDCRTDLGGLIVQVLLQNPGRSSVQPQRKDRNLRGRPAARGNALHSERRSCRTASRRAQGKRITRTPPLGLHHRSVATVPSSR